jgi:hypothetical protein
VNDHDWGFERGAGVGKVAEPAALDGVDDRH